MSTNTVWEKTVARAKSTRLIPFIDDKKLYCFRLDSGLVLVRYADAEQAEAFLDGWFDCLSHG